MLKANDLRERTLEDLRELEKTLTHDVFQNRFKNFTNRLDDTSSIKKSKKDLARVKTLLTERAHGLTPVSAAKASAPVASEPTTTDDAPKAKAKKAAAAPKASAKSAEKPAAAAKPEKTKKTAKKSEG
jgi:large subunit ribosomal protein L29